MLLPNRPYLSRWRVAGLGRASGQGPRIRGGAQLCLQAAERIVNSAELALELADLGLRVLLLLLQQLLRLVLAALKVAFAKPVPARINPAVWPGITLADFGWRT